MHFKIDNTKKWINFTFFLIFGICLNLAFKAFANTCLGRLFYLDTIGTMIVALMAGYFPGLFVALITNVITFFTDPPSVYYVLINLFIAFITTHFYDLYREKKATFTSLMVYYLILISFFSSALGTLLTYIQDKGYPHGDGLIDQMVIYLMDNAKFGFYLAHFVVNLFIHLFDKSICIIISLIFISLVPAKSKVMLRNIGWVQAPLSDWQVKHNKIDIRRFSVKTKLSISLTVACLSITITISIMSRMLFAKYMENQFKEESIGISRLVSSALEPDRVNDYIQNGPDAFGYSKTEDLLYNIRLVSNNIKNIFIYKVNDDGYTVIFDLDSEELKAAEYGTHLDFDKSVLPYVEQLKNGETIEPFITDDENIGYYLTSFCPVYDENGFCVCYAGVDISMNDYESYEKSFLIQLLSLCAGFMITTISAGLWVSKYHLIYPVNTMVKTANMFDYSDEASREENVEKLRSLDIHTGDELENLYHTFLKTIEENRINYSQMLQRSKDLDEVQTKLIMVLADLVENRDASTGDHIKKTAIYTGITMNQMKKMGYYTDQLTDTFISNVIKSAPLHDIGKIKISDTILNKPGKLTDEEFEIMKKHTTYGAEVIEHCISSLPNSEFLCEAKNIAAYHHEKWNGKGYPYGLEGEEIPLSARIMAVADVFDALVSKRVYKDAFSFEKAMSIIEEDSGTHFDPKVAKAFLAASAEVHAAEEYFEKR